MDGEAFDEGEGEIGGDNEEVEDDEFFEVVVVIEAWPEVDELFVGFLFDAVVLNQQPGEIILYISAHINCRVSALKTSNSFPSEINKKDKINFANMLSLGVI